jgi:hypothetical protein
MRLDAKKRRHRRQMSRDHMRSLDLWEQSDYI